MINLEILWQVALMFLVLTMPVPSTPYLLIHFSSEDIVASAIVYFVASTCMCFFLLAIGRVTPIEKLSRLTDSWGLQSSRSKRFSTVAAWSMDQASHLSLKDNLLMRLAGVPVHVLAPIVGAVNGAWKHLILANWILALIDILFYCSLFGASRYFFSNYLPRTFQFLTTWSEVAFLPISLVIIALYLFFGIRKFRKAASA